MGNASQKARNHLYVKAKMYTIYSIVNRTLGKKLFLDIIQGVFWLSSRINHIVDRMFLC